MQPHQGLGLRQVLSQHGGDGPALIVSQEVLGIKGVGPGFKERRIEVPDLKGINWAKNLVVIGGRHRVVVQ